MKAEEALASRLRDKEEKDKLKKRKALAANLLRHEGRLL